MNAVERDSVNQAVGYVFARCEQFISACSASTAIPEAELARRVGALLCAKEGGQILGSLDHLSGMPQESARRSASLQQVAVAKRAYRRARKEPVVYEGWSGKVVEDGRSKNGTRLSENGRKILSSKMKQRWADWRNGKTPKPSDGHAGMIWKPAITRIQLGKKVRVKGYWVKDTTGRSYNGNHWMQKVANRARKNAHVKRMRNGMNKMLKEAKP
jgi:hypothetical protein